MISYTGRTGIGVPHLHFEIRNTDGHPINPLNFYDQVKDKIRPRIQKLGVIPLSEDALVNSSHSPQIFDVSYIRNGVNVIKDPIYVSGRVGLMIKGFDQADGASNKYGFHETAMNVNGLETFRITYDVLHFSTTEHIYTETYYPIWADQKEVYHKLFVEPFNPLQFYKRIPGQDGSVTIADKPAACEISVSDFHGNKSILKVELIPDLRPELNLTEMTRNDSIVYLGFSSQPFRDIQLSAGDSSNTYKKINYFEIVEGSLSRPESGLVMKTKVLDSTTRQAKNSDYRQKQSDFSKSIYY